jgi:hypothetical protein
LDYPFQFSLLNGGSDLGSVLLKFGRALHCEVTGSGQVDGDVVGDGGGTAVTRFPTHHQHFVSQ